MGVDASSSSEMEEARSGCPTGSYGEFATFGFLSFIITMVNTALNVVNTINNNNNNNMNMNTGRRWKPSLAEVFQSEFSTVRCDTKWHHYAKHISKQLHNLKRIVEKSFPS